MTQPRLAIGVMDTTAWHCERCGRAGRIQSVRGAGIYEVLHILEDAHNDVSPECNGDLSKMRVTRVDDSASRAASPITREE